MRKPGRLQPLFLPDFKQCECVWRLHSRGWRGCKDLIKIICVCAWVCVGQQAQLVVGWSRLNLIPFIPRQLPFHQSLTHSLPLYLTQCQSPPCLSCLCHIAVWPQWYSGPQNIIQCLTEMLTASSHSQKWKLPYLQKGWALSFNSN